MRSFGVQPALKKPGMLKGKQMAASKRYAKYVAWVGMSMGASRGNQR